MIKRVCWAIPLLVVVAACERKPEGQTVAVVNGDEVTSGELNAELRNANLPPNTDSSEARNRILQNLIDRKLLVQQAQEDGIDQSLEFLNQQRRMNENLLINMLLSRQLNTSQSASAAEIRQFQESRPAMFADRQIWTLEQLQYPTQTDPQVLTKIGAANSLEDVAQVLSAAGVQFDRARRQVDTSVFPSDIFRRVSALSSGEPFIVPAGQQTVASVVVERQPAPRTGEEARAAALNALRQSQAEKALKDHVKAARQTAEIQYQSGFGPAKR